ncbi:MAG: chemotaxis protein CheW [Thermodesulfobacteriota bacterium]
MDEPATTAPQDIYTQDIEYLVFQSGGQLFAIPYLYLVSILDSPSVTPVPNMAPHVRGVVDFHDGTVPLYDLRIKMGLPSLPEEIREIAATLKLRKQDHLNWLDTLKKEVESGVTVISVETDPHRCAFGRWYDSYRPDSLALQAYMSQFDSPHQKIHRIAVETQQYVKRNDLEGARALIAATEATDLKRLVRLFDEAEEKINRLSFEYAIVIDLPGHDRFALCADGLKHFDRFAEVIYPLPRVFTEERLNFIDAIGRQQGAEGTQEVLILNLPLFLTPDLPPVRPATAA